MSNICFLPKAATKTVTDRTSTRSVQAELPHTSLHFTDKEHSTHTHQMPTVCQVLCSELGVAVHNISSAPPLGADGSQFRELDLLR